MIAGTGSIGLDLTRTVTMCEAADGIIFSEGHEGSGYWIGCQLIRHFTMQADGREEKSDDV